MAETRCVLGLDIGSNSVGSSWVDSERGGITAGTSVFPAGVDESEDKRGDPKGAKRRMTRRTRITLARRAERKRGLRHELINRGLLPASADDFKQLLEGTDPWELRREGLDRALTPHEFGRVLLHLAQRRGALGLHIPGPGEEEEEADHSAKEDGKVKAAIRAVRTKRLERKARTFGEFIAILRSERVTEITTEDKRPGNGRKGPREWRSSVRNKAGNYEHCADRLMIRDEFSRLWEAQKRLGGEAAKALTDELRLRLDDESGDATWRHKGLLFGQRRQTWDLGTLGRCVLEPTERCAPHADMYASRYLVVETVNNLKIIESGKEKRALTLEERAKIKAYLSGPLGMEKVPKPRGKAKKQVDADAPKNRPKPTVSVTDLRILMGWGRASKNSPIRFNIENDEDRAINTDWFSREIVHGAVTREAWAKLNERAREGLNRAILKHDPDQDGDAARLKTGVMSWARLSETHADALVAAWKRRPRPDAKRLNMSRRAVRNLLAVMDRAEPWPDPKRPGQLRWLTEIEARKIIAEDADFSDVTTGRPLDGHTRRRYATGAKGATARDRYYMGKHVLLRNGKPVIGPDGKPLAEPPPAPLISNPVVRKAIHEVRRHLVDYMTTFGRKPDEIRIELAREARMGKMDADRENFRNRLRARISREIEEAFTLGGRTKSQRDAAIDRVVLCVHQGGRCPLCGNQKVPTRITERMAAYGEQCEVAHILPKGVGGHNGLSNIVLAHTKCNRDMGRRTPRQFWEETVKGGFEEGMQWVGGIYGDIQRIKPSETKEATGLELWKCYVTEQARPRRGSLSDKPPNYFSNWADKQKIEQFKKDVKDIQQMTPRQDAATKYASRQVMAYLADAIYDGKGLPERGGERRIFATDGIWTSRLRREWGLFFDPHEARSKGLSNDEEHQRKEKNRGDHRHHAIDAIVIAYCTRQVQIQWEEREKRADADGINTADEEAMENYRRDHRLDPPEPFKSREEFRETVRNAVFVDGVTDKPICHRPVKRKLIGAFHEETLFGPVLDAQGELTGNYTAKKSVLALDPNHLRMPRKESESEAIDRLAKRRQRAAGEDEKLARKWARALVSSPGYAPAIIDPPPGKSGIVRDVGLRARLRECLSDAGLHPDDFSPNEVKKLAESGKMCHASGVPIRSVVLLRTMSDPVILPRRRSDHATGRMIADGDPASLRAYVGGNNHHVEFRANGKGKWAGEIVSAFDAAQRKLARLRALRAARIPKPDAFRKLPKAERRKLAPVLRAIEQENPLVDRRDDEARGGRFVMSLCEGEMLLMKHPDTGEVGYFVVAKLDKPHTAVLVPHWDARAAGERKDANGKKIPNSKREQFSVTPEQLRELGTKEGLPPYKVRVSPLGVVTKLEKD